MTTPFKSISAVIHDKEEQPVERAVALLYIGLHAFETVFDNEGNINPNVLEPRSIINSAQDIIHAAMDVLCSGELNLTHGAEMLIKIANKHAVGVTPELMELVASSNATAH